MQTTPTNPFTGSKQAERYARFRPRYHAIPFGLMQSYLDKPIALALDVGCGTGHSTAALAEFCAEVDGVDLSQDMLSRAPHLPNVVYTRAPAESLPFANSRYDLLNISQAIHWVNQSRFLSEARRVLKPRSWLSIDHYDLVGDLGEGGLPGFREWHADFYHANFPPRPRNENFPSEMLMMASEFQLRAEFPFDHAVPMTVEDFTTFLMTRSNFIGQSEDERRALEAKLLPAYAPFFAGEASVLFAGCLKLYQRV